MPSTLSDLEYLVQCRRNFVALVDGLSLEALNLVPEGFNNNIIWNFGHNIVVHQMLTYGLSGLPLRVPDELVATYKKGTKPAAANPATEHEVALLKSLAFSLLDHFEDDLQAGIFKQFNTYKTSYGITLNSVDQATRFNLLHENMHLGYALALRRAVLGQLG
jgi:hypothetical protein